MALRCWPTPITDLAAEAATIARWRSGVIEAGQGQLEQIRWRPLRRRVSRLESRFVGGQIHLRRAGDRCRLYFHQPRGCPEFLAVDYLVSSRDATLATSVRALQVLEEIAVLRGTYALVCDVANSRISDRALQRWGWEPHAPMSWHRNFIKRLRPFDGQQ